MIKILMLFVVSLFVMSCAKFNALVDLPSTLNDMKLSVDKTNDAVKETNKGMRETNEAIRQQKIGVALAGMQEKDNRASLTPIPFDMMGYAKIMGEAINKEEMLLFVQDYVKKINEEAFENRYPDVDPTTADGQKLLADFEHNKLADLMMITAVSGYLPDALVQDMVNSESEQGGYRDVFYQILMLRTIFYNDLMLNASLMENKLVTLGKINLAIDYNSKVEYIARLPFADQVGLKITGFKNPDMNDGISRQWDAGLALNNWNRIYSAAQQDFKATSFAQNDAQKTQALAAQNAEYATALNTLKNYIANWGAAAPALK